MGKVNTTVRQGTVEDAARAVDIVFPILRSYGIEPEPERLDAHVVSFGTNDPAVIHDYVGEVDGQVMGVITLEVLSAQELKVSNLFVCAQARRKGLGRLLLEQAVTVAKSLGCSRISLETRTMFKEAISLYERSGWGRGPDLPPGYGPDRTYYLDLTL